MTSSTTLRDPSRSRLGRRLAAVSIAAALGMGLAAAPAHAADPRPDTGDGDVSVTSSLTTLATTPVTFEGSGFGIGAGGGQVVTVKLDDAETLNTVTVKPDGTFTGSATLPVGTPLGEHWLRFLGSDPVVSKHTQKFNVVDVMPAGADVSVTVVNGGRGVDAATVTATIAGTGFESGETVTAKVDGANVAWSTAPTVSATGAFSGKLVYTPGTIRAGDHSLVVVRTAPGKDNVTKNLRVEPATTFTSLTRGTTGTLTLANLPNAATISAITFGGTVFQTPVTADGAGKATINYSIPANATLGTQDVKITQSVPTAAAYTGSAKISPSTAPLNEDKFTRVETPSAIEQGLYQSAYSAKNNVLFATTAATTVTSTIYKLDPSTLEVLDSKVPAFVTGNSGALWAAYGVGVDDRNDTIWVTNTRQNSIAVYKQSDLSLVKQFENGAIQHSRDVIVDTARNKVIVSSAAEGTSGDGYVDVYDGTSLALLKRVETGARTDFSPMSLDLDHKKGIVYTVSNSTAKAAAIDISGTTYPVRTFNLDVVKGAKASGVAYDADTNRLWIANQGTDGVTIVDATTGKEFKEVATGAGSLNVVFDSVHKLAYVANFGGLTTTVLDQAGNIVANLTFARTNHVDADGKGSVFAVNKDTGNKVVKWTPKNLTAGTPVVAGTAKVGSKVTATAGVWSTGTTLAYQWKRNGVAIGGAKSSNYTLTAADYAKTITVQVTGTRAGFASVAKSSVGKKVAAGTLKSAKPSISGKAKVGKTLKVKRGSWESGTKFTYKWSANGKAIKGATKSSLKLKSAQKGKKITVTVTGKKTGYASVSKTSSKTAKVAK